jgi:hypothetical protein
MILDEVDASRVEVDAGEMTARRAVRDEWGEV